MYETGRGESKNFCRGGTSRVGGTKNWWIINVLKHILKKIEKTFLVPPPKSMPEDWGHFKCHRINYHYTVQLYVCFSVYLTVLVKFGKNLTFSA